MKTKDAQFLINTWKQEAIDAFRKSDDIWHKLGTGALPQEDDIIYSVYELNAKAMTLNACAEALLAFLPPI